jgi:hypothetical protein
MHLITQPAHVFPCSNSAMKGSNEINRILHHDIAAQTTTELPSCLAVETEPGILVCRLPRLFSKCKPFLM